MWHRSFDQASQLRSGIFSIGFIPIDHASFFLQLIFCDHMIGLHCVVHGASICWSRSSAVLPFVEAGSNSASAHFPGKIWGLSSLLLWHVQPRVDMYRQSRSDAPLGLRFFALWEAETGWQVHFASWGCIHRHYVTMYMYPGILVCVLGCRQIALKSTYTYVYVRM